MATKNYEKEVKELARKKSNKNCFNCGKPGPLNNVVLDFNTFVCTSCAGLHRGFSHRVRSINMSNWTKPELDALAHGGNKRAKKVWLASYVPEAYVIQAEDEKNIQRFMTLVYEKKQWYDPNGAAVKEKKHKKKDKKEKEEEESDDGEGPEHSDNHGHISSTPSHKSSSSDASPHPDPASSTSASGTSHNTSHASTPSSHASSHASSHNNHNNNSSHTNAAHGHGANEQKKGSSDVMDLLTSLDFSDAAPIHTQTIPESSFETSFDNGSSTAATAPPAPTPAMQQAISAITNSLKAVQSNFNLTPQQLKQCVDQALSSLGVGPSSSSSSTSVSPNTNTNTPALPSPQHAVSPSSNPVAKQPNKVQTLLANAQPTPPPPMPGAIALPGFGGSPGFGGMPASSGNPFDDDDDGGAAAAQQQQNYYAAQQAQLRQQQYPQQFAQQTFVQPAFQQGQFGVPGMQVQQGMMVQPGMVPAGYYVPQQAQQIPQQQQQQQQQQQARPKSNDDLFSFANPLPRS